MLSNIVQRVASSCSTSDWLREYMHQVPKPHTGALHMQRAAGQLPTTCRQSSVKCASYIRCSKMHDEAMHLMFDWSRSGLFMDVQDLNVYSASPRGTLGQQIAGYTKLPQFSAKDPVLDGSVILYSTLPGGQQYELDLGFTLGPPPPPPPPTHTPL